MRCSFPEKALELIPDISSTEEWQQIVMHEFFHSFQFNHAAMTGYLKDHTQVLTDSLDKFYLNQEWFRTMLFLENDALLRAVAIEDSVNHYLDVFLKTRNNRRAEFINRFGYDISPYENFWELAEGTARYVEYYTAYYYRDTKPQPTNCDSLFRNYDFIRSDDFEEQPWFVEKSRIMPAYYYVTGFNMCRLLDNLGVPYKDDLFNRPDQPLDERIKTALRGK